MIFSYQSLLSKYSIEPKGIIHIGAHKGEESTIYGRNGTDEVLWIEGNPDLITDIQENISIYPKNIVLQALLSDEDKTEVKFNITNSSMSSSVLELGTHKDQFPDIKVERTISLPAVRFDTLVKKENLDISRYDFVNIDIQGSELPALRGFGALLKNIDYIYSEVNTEKVYEGCTLLEDLDGFLNQKGFLRVELSLKYKSWGDAFYIRQEALTRRDIDLEYDSKGLRLVTGEKIPEKENLLRTSFLYRLSKKIYHKFFPENKRIKPNLIYQSGEYKMIFNLLKQYKKSRKVIVFDIGANKGEFTETVIKHCKALKLNFEIHLFEPQKKCVEILRTRFGSDSNIIINPFAVSNKGKFIDFYVENIGGSSSSPYNRTVFNHADRIQVRSISLNEYIAKKEIPKINLIKIDTEGHELKVIKSASEYLNIIDNIQFEYGGTYIDANTSLNEVYNYLRDFYHLGKISPTGVNFTPYKQELEDFQYANYLAEKRDLNNPPADYSK